MAAAHNYKLAALAVALLALLWPAAAVLDLGSTKTAGCFVGWLPLVGGKSLCEILRPKPAPTGEGLRDGYYKDTCPQAEDLVRKAVKEATDKDRSIGAGLIRLFFHDAFVRGADASVLLNTTATPGTETERQGDPNKDSLRGFEVIDAAKAAIEDVPQCRGKVSCADIVAFAARDASFVLSDGRINFSMPAGRYDGRQSVKSETDQLPGPGSDLDTLKKMFAAQGLNTTDMVTLSGAHSIGKARCLFFTNRLSDMDSEYASELNANCTSSSSNRVNQDRYTPELLDSQYYSNIYNKSVLFASDATLISRDETNDKVKEYAVNKARTWETDFAAAMVKMGKIGVTTKADIDARRKTLGVDVEIRNVCWKVNSL